MKYKLFFSFMLVIALLLVGCSGEEEEPQSDGDAAEAENDNVAEETNSDQDEANKASTNQDESAENEGNSLEFLADVPEVPQETNEFIHYPKGPYAGIYADDDSVIEDVQEEVRKLEPLPENASEDQLDNYFNYLYSLVAEDFPNPQDTMKKWEFGSSGNPDLPDSRYHFKENYNVEVLLDGSGSMGAYIGDKTMMQIAKESINGFMKQVPEDANVSFRVYGHKGTGSESDKEMSCAAIEQVYGYAPYEEDEFQTELDKIEPAGWTPLADALKQAQEALTEFDAENNTNLIYVVSDGVETCGGNPVEVAESLSDSNAQPIINIIGFNVDTEAQEQLKEMADVSGGIFATADNQEQLEEEFNRAEEVLKAWEDWKEEALSDADYSEVENSLDITDLFVEWGQKNTFQYNNLSRLIRLAEDEGIINSDQRGVFYSKRDEVRDRVDGAQEEVVEELESISAEKIEEMKQSIEERYNTQTED